MATDDDGFLSRWARRKAQARQGQALAEPAVPVPAPPVPPVPPLPAAATVAVAPAQVAAEVAPAPQAPPPPTLDDVARWPVDAPDYSRFVARGVQPEVKNAALKKLFTDPHFNVMDGLDTYIEDYGKPDPLPLSMLRQMTQGRFLGLFTEEDEAAAAPPSSAALPVPPAHNPEDAPPADPPCPPAPLPNENADLRLQPHDAAGRPRDPARAGDEPGCAH